MAVHDEQRSVFFERTAERLAELELDILTLEITPGDKGLINRIFRDLHTIKGSSAMLGYNDISSFTHEIETVFDLLRNDKFTVSREFVSLALTARDRIKAMLDAPSDADPEVVTRNRALVSALKKVIAPFDHPSPVAALKSDRPPETVTKRVACSPKIQHQ
jgi:two-component system chemotaxis sensor kinase CheA